MEKLMQDKVLAQKIHASFGQLQELLSEADSSGVIVELYLGGDRVEHVQKRQTRIFVSVAL